jgi:hypothetical protein
MATDDDRELAARTWKPGGTGGRAEIEGPLENATTRNDKTRSDGRQQVHHPKELPRYHRQDSHESVCSLLPHFELLANLSTSGMLAGGFGGVAGFFALFFFAEVPRVREDIMKKVPILGSYFNVEIPPEDNPF